MFSRLKKWWDGELIQVQIIEKKNEVNGFMIAHVLVSLPDGTRRWVNGHIGMPGEKVVVNTWDLHKY